MAEESGQEKTEKATSRKREKAREEGQVVKSQEIASVMVLLMGISVLYIFGHYFYPKALAVIKDNLDFGPVPHFDLLYCISFFKKKPLVFFCVGFAGDGCCICHGACGRDVPGRLRD